ncbi:MAG: 6-carboxytetrahydropterin synthase [Ignavibacteriae bacterium]|nr:6-carboxytetrahydropterin synthase [Ignavibacteriota bacterium]
MLYITKSATFSASHRLYNPEFSDEENEIIFDKCNNYYGHGHNYTLEVTVAGKPDPKTGYIIDLKILKRIIQDEILTRVDHKHLNHDVDFLKGIIPTVENLAIVFWRRLQDKFPYGKLHCIKLYETDGSYVEYFGDTIEIPIYKISTGKE